MIKVIMFSKLRLENQEKKTVYLCLNKPLSFSTVDVQQNVKCLCSAESVMRAVDYSAFEVKTYFITQSGDFIKTQEFTETPGDDEKLMTNDTVVASQAIKPSDIYEEGAVVFPVLHGPMGEDGSIQGFLRNPQIAIRGY